MSFLALLFIHILRCIWLKILFTESKYLVSDWGYTCLMKTIKKVKNRIELSIYLVIIILCIHHFILLKLFSTIKSFILYHTNQTTLKSGYNFTTYHKFTDTSWIEELQTRKRLSPIWASSSISRKWQVMGFWALASQISNNYIKASKINCSDNLKLNFTQLSMFSRSVSIDDVVISASVGWSPEQYASGSADCRKTHGRGQTIQSHLCFFHSYRSQWNWCSEVVVFAFLVSYKIWCTALQSFIVWQQGIF